MAMLTCTSEEIAMKQGTKTPGLVHFVTQDYSGITRGRGFPQQRLEGYLRKGVCWTPANLGINMFGSIVENEWGAQGDILMMPDPATKVFVDNGTAVTPLHYYHCDFLNLDGSPWDACPRNFLKRQIQTLAAMGIKVIAAFEHEFMLTDIANPAPPFSLEASRTEEFLCSEIVDALQQAGVDPEMCLPEYAQRQFEVTCSPVEALQAADRAINVREVVREICRQNGRKVSFSPMVTGNSGTNGVHVHVSLWSTAGEPLTYDPTRPGQLSEVASQFTTGMLEHMAALTALTAPGVVSYQRLRPNSWSAAYACIGQQNREASLRIAPLSNVNADAAAKQANIEFRAADALSSPYLVLGALLAAGIDGIQRSMVMPELVAVNPCLIPKDEHSRHGLKALPGSLGDALKELENDAYLKAAMGTSLLSCYRAVKQSEIHEASEKDDFAIRDMYSAVY
ncbi:hypothetical protein B0D71_02865 [Pseudomonas laurylsulfativorans]|uniref:GS catalytic domain-containing protein n=2 Tax=Pseudomonas laurylsulfativorans TaxID=1943631 RepID=A0A2S3VV22_9PSED|nr:hypothetical protein B0D71_02865 [Pseudomonas laurylsulfativorans]